MTEPPILLFAPIRGVTHAAFRTLFAKHFGGFDAALAPFVVPEKGRLPPTRHLHDATPAANPALPTVPQILTGDPVAFVSTAQWFFEAGCQEVNWNLGCPHPMVTRRSFGAGLLPFPDRIHDFLTHVIDALGPRVSVKLRLGMHAAEEADPVLDVLNRHPLTEVTLHPRTAAQMYRGHVDLEAFSRCLTRSRHPLTFNGDIVSAASFRDRRADFPTVTRWMIGRGAVSDPFLASRLKNPSLRPDTGRMKSFHDALLEHHRTVLSGDAHVLHKMQELWAYWTASFPPGAKAVKHVVRAKSMDAYLWHVGKVFEGGKPST